MIARFCPQCGVPALEGARVCGSCGSELGPAAVPAGAISPADQVAPPPPSQPPGSPTALGAEVPPMASRRSRPVRGCLLVVVLLVLVGGVGVGALLISAGLLERLKPLENVTFTTIDRYATGRYVTLTGGLSASDPITCFEDGKRCPVELVDAADSAVGSGHPRTIFIYVDRSSLESGPRVHLASGGSVETGALVRVTGRVCRTDAEPPETCVVVELIESAGGTVALPGRSTPTPRPTPTATPTPTPAPLVTEDELAAACKGTPIPRAARYAGTIHPLVVVAYEPDEAWVVDSSTSSYDINARWDDGLWPGPIQLVVCVDGAKTVKVGTCGSYKRFSDGEVGQIIRYRYTTKVRVVVATTGKDLQYRTFAGTTPQCASSLSLPGSGPPPWVMYGDGVSDDVINAYATSVSTQKVK